MAFIFLSLINRTIGLRVSLVEEIIGADIVEHGIGRFYFLKQWTLVISKSKGPSGTLRDIRTSTYQIWRIEENTNGTTKFHK